MSKRKLEIGDGSSATKSDQMLDFKYREGPVIRTRQSVPEQARDLWNNTLIGKLHVGVHTVTTSSLIEDMKYYWGSCHNNSYCDLGNNFMSLTFESNEDKQKVLDSFPHCFYGHLLILREWPLPHQPPNITIISKQLTFTTSPFWIHAQGVPREFWSEEMGMDLGKVAGEVMQVDYEEESEMEDDDDKEIEEGLRIRVKVDITRSLALGCWFYISKDNFLWISFEYEDLPLICYRCGLLGHIKTNCRTSLTTPSIGSEMIIDLPNGSSSEQPVVPDDNQVLLRDLTKRGYGPWIYYDQEDVLDEDEVEMLSDVEEDV